MHFWFFFLIEISLFLETGFSCFVYSTNFNGLLYLFSHKYNLNKTIIWTIESVDEKRNQFFFQKIWLNTSCNFLPMLSKLFHYSYLFFFIAYKLDLIITTSKLILYWHMNASTISFNFLILLPSKIMHHEKTMWLKLAWKK
jgi:hypothetical protein